MNDLAAAILQTPLARPITRADVMAFEDRIRAHPAHLTAKDFTTLHHFVDGVYMRELHIPAGMIVVGKIHKHRCVAMLVRGTMDLLINGRIMRVVAPRVSISPAGIKRIGRAIDKCIFITVHATDTTDIDELEQELACDSEEEYQAFLDEMAQPWLS
jgi:hypothetical protein